MLIIISAQLTLLHLLQQSVHIVLTLLLSLFLFNLYYFICSCVVWQPCQDTAQPLPTTRRSLSASSEGCGLVQYAA